MKVLLLSSLLVIAVGHKCGYFTTADDHYDVAAVLKDPVQVKYHMDCFVGRRICEPFSFSYKKNMPEAIPTACLRCTDGQKHMWNIWLNGLKKYYPTEYLAFQQKYDRSNIFLDELMKAVENY
uniref:Chemosensory protein 13 n=1 Tax=Pieris rapae TaxID=64459 RepID=A0A5B8GB41_PIERA|nr:chemosensory protein 13 [Pieris rapae]